MGKVSVRRAAVIACVAGLIAAGYVFLRFTVKPAPDFLLEAFGAPPRGIEREGGRRVHYESPPGIDQTAAFRRRFGWAPPRFVGNTVDFDLFGSWPTPNALEWWFQTGHITIRTRAFDDDHQPVDTQTLLDWQSLESVRVVSYLPVMELHANEAGAVILCGHVGEQLTGYLDERYLGSFVVDSSMCEAATATIEIQSVPDVGQEEWFLPIVAPGGSVRITTVPTADLSDAKRCSRLTAVLVVGALVMTVAWLLLGMSSLSWGTRTRRLVGRPALRRLAITSLVPITVIVCDRLFALGVDGVHAAIEDRADFTFAAVGITPVIGGFVVVELFSLLLPRWIRHRPDGRAALDKAALVLGVLIALVQAFLLSTRLAVLAGVDERHYVFSFDGFPLIATLTMSFTLGTIGLWLAARHVTKHGSVNGYALIFVSGWLLERWQSPHDSDLSNMLWDGRGLFAASFVLLVVTAVAMLRLRVVKSGALPLRLPTSGMFPVAPGAGIVAVLWILTLFHQVPPIWGTRFRWYFDAHPWVLAGMMLGATLVWAWLFARPKLLADVAKRAGLEAPDRRQWAKAAFVTVCFLVVIVALETEPFRSRGTVEIWPFALLNPFMALLAVGVVLDIVADVRVNRRELAAAWSLHQPQYIGAVEHVLDEAKIPYHLHGSHVRTLLGFFGPFAPIVVFVPAAQLDDAKAKIGALFPDETNVTPATPA